MDRTPTGRAAVVNGGPTETGHEPPRKRGIFYGWWIVVTGLMANFAYAEQFNTTYGVFIHQLGAEMGWGRTALAGVPSLARIPEAILGSVLGPLVDRHGARWFMAFGGVLLGVSFMALSTITELWQLYLYKGVIMAVGARSGSSTPAHSWRRASCRSPPR
jgi:sugar phosphate permease